MTQYYKDYGAQLIRNGYNIVPIVPGAKRPSVKNWPQHAANDAVYHDLIKRGHANDGVGILTALTPAIDIDVHDASIVEKLITWCEKHIGATVQRVGQAPKTLLVYRTETPFSKVCSAAYQDRFGQMNRIEILGQGQQFVAFANHPNTKQPYQWLGDSVADKAIKDLPLLTLDHIDKLLKYFKRLVPDSWSLKTPAKGKAKPVQSDDNWMLSIAPTLELSPGQIKESLAAIDADDHDVWIKVGMALHHQFGGSKEGFALWDTWSRKSVNYGDTKLRWKSFNDKPKNREPITLASVLAMAKSTEKEGQLAREIACLERYIYVKEGNQVADLNDPPADCLMPYAVFKNATQHEKFSVSYTTASGKPQVKSVPKWEFFMNHEDFKEVRNVGYAPNQERVYVNQLGVSYLNTFQLPNHRVVSGTSKLNIFFNHMEYLFPNPEEREWFIAWIACNVQRPHKRCKVTPLHISTEHGTGRGWIGQLMEALLGEWNVSVTQMSILSGEMGSSQFNEYLYHSLLCIVDEVYENSRRYSINKRMRSILSENKQDVNTKFGKKQSMVVYTNFFFQSNYRMAMILEKADRRINVLSGPESFRSESYYDDLYDWLANEEAIAQLFQWLMNYDLTDFKWKRSMHTTARAHMIEGSMSHTETIFRQLLDEPPQPVMTFGQIIQAMEALQEDVFNTSIDSKQAVRLLQEHAYQPLKEKQLRLGQKRYRPWQLDKNSYSPEQMRQFIEQFDVSKIDKA